MNTIKGKVHAVVDGSGTSKKGDAFSKSTLVVDTGSQYDNLTPVEFFGKSPGELGVSTGQQVTVSVYIGGSEWKGKFYPRIKGNEIVVDSEKREEPATAAQPQSQAPIEDLGESLPF